MDKTDPQFGEQAALVRLIDAAANRASEGLRVAEDYTRFVLDDGHLTRLLKEMRHELTETLAGLPMAGRLAVRDTRADVGTEISTPGETARESCHQIAMANIVRAQQALRSLEEVSKAICADAAARLKQLRYRAYTIQKAIDVTSTNATRLSNTQLYVLTDGCANATTFETLIRALVDAGVGAIQLRDKQLHDRALLARARALRRITSGSETLFIMNDRPDLAVLANADGVHVGQEELTVKDARAIVGNERLVGVSTHSVDQARAAVLDGASYLGVGPVFRSSTKTFDEFAGLEFVQAVAEEIQLPWFAIGGIDHQNVAEVIRAGALRVACGAAICRADQPDVAARDMLARLASASTLA